VAYNHTINNIGESIMHKIIDTITAIAIGLLLAALVLHYFDVLVK
jgi:uncharacterized membrane protein